MNENYDNILESFGNEVNNEAMKIHVVCLQGNAYAELEVYAHNSKESVVDAALEAMGLESLKKEPDYYPVLLNVRDQSTVADDSPIGDFVRDSEKLKINGFGGVA